MSQHTPKVLAIGYGRTGTTSLAQALTILGYNNIDYPFPDAMLNHRFHLLDPYDSATDSPVALHFPHLDARYPGSRFIMTTRDPDDWLESVRKFHERLPNMGLTEAQFNVALALSRELYGTDTFDAARFRRAFLQHDQRVRAYFKHRPDDLLIINITAGDGWDQLCPFLDKPIPSVTFPRRNRAPDRAADDLHLNQFWT